MKYLIKALTVPAIVFLIHIFLVSINLYSHWPEIDIPMHFLGGAAIGQMFSVLVQESKQKKQYSSDKKIEFIFAVSFVALIAVLWEFLEYLAGATTGIFAQRGVSDTMGDLLLGLIGGPIGYLIGKVKLSSHNS